MFCDNFSNHMKTKKVQKFYYDKKLFTFHQLIIFKYNYLI